MALFGSNWNDGDDDVNMFSHWLDDAIDSSVWSDVASTSIVQKTTKEILDEIDIKEIEQYLRNKKLEKLKNIK